MASVEITALGRTSIQFVDTGVKVNGDYYNNVLLRQGLLRWNARTKNASSWFFGTRWILLGFRSFTFHKVV